MAGPFAAMPPAAAPPLLLAVRRSRHPGRLPPPGVDKHLSPVEIDALCRQYTVPKTASLDVFCYRELLHELELVFTVPVGAAHASHVGSPAMVLRGVPRPPERGAAWPCWPASCLA
jgi:hypothetical protein